MNIFVLDQFPLMSEMIVMLLRRIHAQANIVTAHTFKQLNSLIDKYEEADAVIIDPQSIGCLGSLSVAHIAERLPETKIIVFTDIDSNDISGRYIQSGAHNIISKREKVKKITIDLQEVIYPKSIKSDSSSNKIAILKISKRHRQLINLLGQGCNNTQIAARLNISENTVKIHFYRLFKILGVKSRLQALNFAKTNGWIIDNIDV